MSSGKNKDVAQKVRQYRLRLEFRSSLQRQVAQLDSEEESEVLDFIALRLS